MVIVGMVEGRVGNAVLPTDGVINGGQKSLPTLSWIIQEIRFYWGWLWI